MPGLLAVAADNVGGDGGARLNASRSARSSRFERCGQQLIAVRT